MLPKIICVLLVVRVVDVVGYQDEEAVHGGGSYGHYKEDNNEEAEPLPIRRYVAKQTVKTLSPGEIQAVRGAIKQILSGHKQDRLFSPMPSNENLEKRSIRDKRIYEPVTGESYDNQYIRTKFNYFTENTDETKSESTIVSTTEPEISSKIEITDENYEGNEFNAEISRRRTLPIPLRINDISSTDYTTKESYQTETNEELIGATEAIRARPTLSGSISTDDTLSNTESSTKEDQTDTNEEISAIEATRTRSSPPIVFTFQRTDESTKETNEGFIETSYKTDDSFSTDESSSIENFQVEGNNQVVRTGPDSATTFAITEETEVKESEAEESEAKNTEVKDIEEKDIEAKKNEMKETEVREPEAKEVELEESELEDAEVKETEAKETKTKEGDTEETEEKANKVEASEVEEPKDKTEAKDTTKTRTRTKKIITTTEPTTTTTTKRTTKFQLDVPALLEIIANLTYDYEMNLTDNLNETLLRLSIPTCETPTTTEKISDFIDYDANATGTIVAKCFVCGMEEESVPRHAQCADAFAGDFLPLVPVDMTARGRISKYRKYCRYLDVPHYLVNASMPRSVYGRWTGGCSVRWIDLSGIYTQRFCRNKNRAIMGRHFASKRMAKLEMALTSLKNGCISSPMATLVPLSRGISLYARFHACVCTGSWCNAASSHHHWLVILVPILVYVSPHLATTR